MALGLLLCGAGLSEARADHGSFYRGGNCGPGGYHSGYRGYSAYGPAYRGAYGYSNFGYGVPGVAIRSYSAVPVYRSSLYGPSPFGVTPFGVSPFGIDGFGNVGYPAPFPGARGPRVQLRVGF